MEQNSLICGKMDTVTFPVITHSHTASEPFHSQGYGQPNSPPAKSKGRAALLWSISGTLLSAVGFIALALFEQYNDGLNELRHDLKHFNETSAEFVKKESVRKHLDQLKDYTKELQMAAASRAEMQRELQASEQDRKEMERELQKLRERLATIEGRLAATPVVAPIPPPDRK